MYRCYKHSGNARQIGRKDIYRVIEVKAETMNKLHWKPMARKNMQRYITVLLHRFLKYSSTTLLYDLNYEKCAHPCIFNTHPTSYKTVENAWPSQRDIQYCRAIGYFMARPCPHDCQGS